MVGAGGNSHEEISGGESLLDESGLSYSATKEPEMMSKMKNQTREELFEKCGSFSQKLFHWKTDFMCIRHYPDRASS